MLQLSQGGLGLPPILPPRLGRGDRRMVSGVLGLQLEAVAYLGGRLKAGDAAPRPAVEKSRDKGWDACRQSDLLM